MSYSLVHSHHSHHCGANVDSSNDHGGQQGHLSTAAQALKQLRGVEDDTVDTGELLQSRHNDGQHQLRAVGRLQDGLPLVAGSTGSSSSLTDVLKLNINICTWKQQIVSVLGQYNICMR